MSTTPDLCIIGAGALGVEMALYARRLGVSVVLADRGKPEPGDALEHSRRSAALFASAERAQAMRTAPALGLGAADPKLQLKPMVERSARFAEERGRSTSPEILTARGVTVMRGAVGFVDGRTVRIGDLTIKPRRVLVAIGGEPVLPALPGLADIKTFTLDSILGNQRKLTHVIIIGGDAAALEQAQIQRRLGAAVTLIPHGELLGDFDPETVAILVNALEDEGIVVRRESRVVAIHPRSQGTGVEIEVGAEREHLDASHILVSCGREAELESLDLAKAKLKAGASNSRFIQFVGASAGQTEWAVARAAGITAIARWFGPRSSAAAPVPRLVMTEPGLAQIGPSVSPAGIEESVLRESFTENDRAAAMGRGRGLLKVSVDQKGKILRASAVGPAAPELAGVLALAMARGLKVGDLADLPLPAPSLFEIISRLGENFLALAGVWKQGQRKGAWRRLLRS